MKADIVYIQYTNPACYPPLQHSSRMFANAGMKVLFLGTGSGGQSNSFEFPYHENITVKRWNFCKPGWKQKVHYAAFCLWSSFTAWWSGAKWVYASDPFSCPAAILCRIMFGRKILYHEHDSPNIKTNKYTLFESIQKKARKYIGKNSDIVVFPNQKRSDLFAKETGRELPINIVWNTPSQFEYPDQDKVSTKKTKIFYHGSVSENLLPIYLIEVLKICPDLELEFVGYNAGLKIDYIAEFLNAALLQGIGNRVTYKGFFSRKDLLAYCSSCLIGLAIFPMTSDNVNLKYLAGASNKVFDYLLCGMLVLLPKDDQWVELLGDNERCFFCDTESVESIVVAIKDMLEYGEKAQLKEENTDSISNKGFPFYEISFKEVAQKIINAK